MKFVNEPDKIAYIYAYVLLIILYIFQGVLYFKNNVNTDPITVGLIMLSTLFYPFIDNYLKSKNQNSMRLLMAFMFYTNIAYIIHYTLSDENTRVVKMIRRQSIIATVIASLSVVFVIISKIKIDGYFIPSVILFTLTLLASIYLSKEKLLDDFTPYVIIYMLLIYVMYDTKKCYSNKNVNLIACTNSTFLDLLKLISPDKLKK